MHYLKAYINFITVLFNKWGILVQVYNRWKSTTKDGEELRRWSAISQAYITEVLKDASDTNVLITHNLTWRSESKNNF